MTTIEKKMKITKALESLSNEQLEETMEFISKVKENDIRRKEYIQNLLIKEKNLFDRLAQ